MFANGARIFADGHLERGGQYPRTQRRGVSAEIRVRSAKIRVQAFACFHVSSIAARKDQIFLDANDANRRRESNRLARRLLAPDKLCSLGERTAEPSLRSGSRESIAISGTVGCGSVGSGAPASRAAKRCSTMNFGEQLNFMNANEPLSEAACARSAHRPG